MYKQTTNEVRERNENADIHRLKIIRAVEATNANSGGCYCESNSPKIEEWRVLRSRNGYWRRVLSTSKLEFSRPRSLFLRLRVPIGKFIELRREQAARLNCERIFSAMSEIPSIRRTQILGLRALPELPSCAYCAAGWILNFVRRGFPPQSYREVSRVNRVTRWATYDRRQSLWQIWGAGRGSLYVMCACVARARARARRVKVRTQSMTIFPRLPFLSLLDRFSGVFSLTTGSYRVTSSKRVHFLNGESVVTYTHKRKHPEGVPSSTSNRNSFLALP